MAANKKDWNLVVWVFGWLLNLAIAFREAIKGKHLSFEVFDRLGTLKGKDTVAKILRVIHDDWLEEASPLYYRVRVNKGPLPPISVLELLYPGGVEPIFEGFVWEQHSVRQGSNAEEAEDLLMVVKYFREDEIRQMGGLDLEKVVAWGLKNGLVPANEKETHAFGINQETRRLQYNVRIVGLGSFVQISTEDKAVAVLCAQNGEPEFSWEYVENIWDECDPFVFLFVRK